MISVTLFVRQLEEEEVSIGIIPSLWEHTNLDVYICGLSLRVSPATKRAATGGQERIYTVAQGLLFLGPRNSYFGGIVNYIHTSGLPFYVL